MMKIYVGFLLVVIVIVFLGLYRIDYFSPTEQEGEGYYIGNLHTHTTASDGNANYNQMINEAIKLNFSFIAITDHNIISPTVKLLCPIDKRILCIIGEEVATLEGHVLAIGINTAIPIQLSVNETITRIHEQGGIAIAVHPGSEDNRSISFESANNNPFDAIECNPPTNCNVINKTQRVYNSDAHTVDQVSVRANECWLNNLSWSALKESIKAGDCSLFTP